jgi:hypothetical protein
VKQRRKIKTKKPGGEKDKEENTLTEGERKIKMEDGTMTNILRRGDEGKKKT